MSSFGIADPRVSDSQELVLLVDADIVVSLLCQW